MESGGHKDDDQFVLTQDILARSGLVPVYIFEGSSVASPFQAAGPLVDWCDSG